MKIAKRFHIRPSVASDPTVRIALGTTERPLMVCAILDFKRAAYGEIEHFKSVFIDDQHHDWSFDEKTGELRYYSHAVRAARMCEDEGDEVERVDIIIIYEFEPDK